MKSITLSTGDIYFENITCDIKMISRVKIDALDKKRWFFILDTGISEAIYFSSEEQAEKDREKLLLFVSQGKSKKGGDK